MAGNKKIFELPLRTGVTIDDRLAIVDSGDTTTYSVKVSDLRDGVGVNTLDSLTGDIVFSGTNIDISTSGQTIVLSASTGGGGGGTGNLESATGTTSFKTSNITDDSIIQGDESMLIGYPNNSSSGINSTGTNNIIIGSGEIDSGSRNLVVAASKENNVAVCKNSGTYGGGVFARGQSTNNSFWGGIAVGTTFGGTNGGSGAATIGGRFNFANSDYSFNASSESGNNVTGVHSMSICSKAGSVSGNYSGKLSSFNSGSITGDYSATLFGGEHSTLSNDYSVFLGGSGNTISNDRSVILGGSGLTTSYDDEVLVPNLTIANYASLNFSNDATAAAGGIVLGQVYHHNGDLKIRIT